jgi:hyperosmotically inducible protein
MKLFQKPLLMTAALAVVMLAGCGQHTKSDEVTQNDEQTTTPQSTNDTNTMGHAAASIDDATITNKVKAAIVAEPALKATAIQVKTNDGVVTLSGTIDAPEKAERAKQLAQTIDGVKTVNNELTVKAAT